MAGGRYPFYPYMYTLHYQSGEESQEEEEEDRRERTQRFLDFIQRRFFTPAEETPSCTPLVPEAADQSTQESAPERIEASLESDWLTVPDVPYVLRSSSPEAALQNEPSHFNADVTMTSASETTVSAMTASDYNNSSKPMSPYEQLVSTVVQSLASYRKDVHSLANVLPKEINSDIKSDKLKYVFAQESSPDQSENSSAGHQGPKGQIGNTSPKRKMDDPTLTGLHISERPPEAKGAKRELQTAGGGNHEPQRQPEAGSESEPEKQPGRPPQRERESRRAGPWEAVSGAPGRSLRGGRLALLHRERRYDVEDLVKTFNRHRSRPVSPANVDRLMELPADVIEGLRDEFYFADVYTRAGKRRPPVPGIQGTEGGEVPLPPPVLETFSDEDSDEVTVRLEVRFPGPIQQATFLVTDEVRLLRLLILGGVTVARGRQVDPAQNPDFVVIDRMITDGAGQQVVDTLKDVSVKGRSSKQDGLVFALAKCCRCKDLTIKRAAYDAIQVMCRTPTQLFQLVKYIEEIGQHSEPKSTGWGRGLRRAVSKWYNSAADNPVRLAMHVSKYQQRHGWSHRDLFRLSHIKPVNEAIGFIVRLIVKGLQDAEKYFLEDGYLDRPDLEKVHKYLKAVDEAKQSRDVARTVQLIREMGLVREHLRTEMLREPEVWTALLQDMPLTALIRNLAKMTSLNLFETEANRQQVVSKLSSAEALHKARVHPFRLLLAHHVYSKGEGDKGNLQWKACPEIVGALESAFYRSFQNVEATGKRILIALDISGSMTAKLMDSPVEIREAATLMAMVTCRVETQCDIVGFHHKLVPLEVFKDPGQTLGQLVEATHALGFGTTDCSKPMTWARRHGKAYDAFIIYTDNETNSHRLPPYAALRKYRRVMGIPTAKLVVVGMTASSVSIAQPDDLHMLDVVGFDPDTPDLISQFLRGELE